MVKGNFSIFKKKIKRANFSPTPALKNKNMKVKILYLPGRASTPYP